MFDCLQLFVIWFPFACALAWLAASCFLFPFVGLRGFSANCPGPGGCASGYFVFACASGLAEYSLPPLLSVVPLLRIGCSRFQYALLDLLCSVLLPLGVST